MEEEDVIVLMLKTRAMQIYASSRIDFIDEMSSGTMFSACKSPRKVGPACQRTSSSPKDKGKVHCDLNILLQLIGLHVAASDEVDNVDHVRL